MGIYCLFQCQNGYNYSEYFINNYNTVNQLPKFNWNFVNNWSSVYGYPVSVHSPNPLRAPHVNWRSQVRSAACTSYKLDVSGSIHYLGLLKLLLVIMIEEKSSKNLLYSISLYNG